MKIDSFTKKQLGCILLPAPINITIKKEKYMHPCVNTEHA